MRPSPAQAKAKVNEYIAFLEENGVPTALFKERVKDIVDWGESVRLRKPNPAAPKSPEMKGIQSALDGMCRSEKYVREQRRGKYPHYPYASEEQKTLAETRPHTYTVLHTHTRTHAHTHTHTHKTCKLDRPAGPPDGPLRMQNRTQSHSYAHMHARTHACTHAHTHTRTHAHRNMHTHTWARNHARS